MAISAAEKYRLDLLIDNLDRSNPPMNVEDKVKYIKSRVSVFTNKISDFDLKEYLKTKGWVM
jgi:hypothetical protein